MGLAPAGLATCSRLLGDSEGAQPRDCLCRPPEGGGSEPSEVRSWFVASPMGDGAPNDSLRRDATGQRRSALCPGQALPGGPLIPAHPP